MANKNRITIIGGGLAGLVAAVDLAKCGFRVLVKEKEATIGGEEGFQPSVHSTPLQKDKLWGYIGINLDSCFKKIQSNDPLIFVGTKQMNIKGQLFEGGIWTCERSKRVSSINSYLYKMALDEGVDFQFNNKITIEELKKRRENTIIATGFWPELYSQMHLPTTPLYGYTAHKKIDGNEVTTSIYLGRFSIDYAYVASVNGLMFSLLFSRRRLKEKNLDLLKRTLKETQGIKFDRWYTINGLMPNEARLFFKEKRLAGTCAGMIEPYFLFGITGALISGKIAALTFTNKEKATQDFNSFTQHFKKGINRNNLITKLRLKRSLIKWAAKSSRIRRIGYRHASHVSNPAKWFR
jgi:hypothetical protein